MTELLKTKLYIPRPRSKRVPRPRLIDRLNEGLDKKLTLISAPAGFGKTSILSEWILQSPRCVTWLSLDESDNDPVQFWMYFIRSLQTLSPNIGKQTFSFLNSQQLSTEAILTNLINSIADFPDNFAMVLDDYHQITNQETHKALAYLVDHQPRNMHLIIPSRADPFLPIARLRARNEVNELRAEDLRFNLEETMDFLKDVWGMDLSEEQLSALEQRTEGWIAGLQLVALSMQGKNDIGEFVSMFTGSHRFIISYLIEEVVNLQPKGIKAFLIKTSILDHLCAPLCEAVSGEENAQARLKYLESRNLFTFPFDDEGYWYRYHPLFAEVLRVYLKSNQADILPDLHLRASLWFEQTGFIDEAIQHALAGQHEKRTVELVEKYAWEKLSTRELFTVRGWLEKLSQETIYKYPWLVLIHCTLLTSTGKLDMADRLLAETVHLFETPDPSPRLQGELARIKANLTRFHGQLNDAIQYSEEALRTLPQEEIRSRAATLTNLAIVYSHLGRMEDATTTLEQVIELDSITVQFDMWEAMFGIAGLQLRKGDLSAAMGTSLKVIKQLEQLEVRPNWLLGLTYSILGQIHFSRNELDKSADFLKLSIQDLRNSIEQIILALNYANLAKVHQARGDYALALETLMDADAWLAEMHLNDLGFSRIISCAYAYQWIRQNQIGKLNGWMSTIQLSDAEFHTYPGRWERTTLARAHLLLREPAKAVEILDPLIEITEEISWNDGLIELSCLRALALKDLGKNRESLSELEKGLTLGEQEDYIRPFIEEGEPMQKLLLVLQADRSNKKKNAQLDGYIERILSAFAYTGKGASLISGEMRLASEQFNQRELEILKYIADGYSNREIAEKLILANSTVKWYINGLYTKLGAKSRTHALAIARDLKLL